MWVDEKFFNIEKRKMIEPKECAGMEKIGQLADDKLMPPLRG
jgi:hypothetical protein